jgi:hypothetical protein
MNRALIIMALIPFMIIGCSSPKIDTSTDENMKTSIAKVRKSLSEEKREEFDDAITTLALSEISLEDIFSESATGIGTTEEKMKSVLDGKTGLEVIAAAEKVIQERKRREKEQALLEIQELEERKATAEKDAIELAKFRVLRSRYYKRKREFIGDEPIVELTVHNETEYPVSRAYFVGTVASPDRSVPWIKDSFNYEIKGGLEPGEKATWHLAPNMFSDWGTVDVPKDAILTVEVVQLDGADGESLFSSITFDKEDEERLSELKSKYEIE